MKTTLKAIFIGIIVTIFCCTASEFIVTLVFASLIHVCLIFNSDIHNLKKIINKLKNKEQFQFFELTRLENKKHKAETLIRHLKEENKILQAEITDLYETKEELYRQLYNLAKENEFLKNMKNAKDSS